MNNLTINLDCEKCGHNFDKVMLAIEFDQFGDLLFNPLPECPRCGATEEMITLSHSGQEKIEDMMYSNQIKKVKANYSRRKQ
jgi:hypothetical protein